MDLHVRIEVFDDSVGNLGKALRAIQEADPDFLWPDRPWWHKPGPNNPRGWLAGKLSTHGLRGRLSVEPHRAGDAWNAAPPPRWTGFSPRRRS